MMRLKKFCIEFPETTGINEEGFIRLAKAIAKCHSMKSFGLKLINVPGTTYKSDKLFGEIHRRNPQIEELIMYWSVKKGVIKSCIPIEPRVIKPQRNPKLRKFSNTCGMTSGWYFLNLSSSSQI